MGLDRPLHDGQAEPATARPLTNGSKSRARMSSGMPGPLSRTSSRMGDSIPLPRGTSLWSAGPVLTVTVTGPPAA